jgi:tRNA pseudouridine(55) synthase
MLLLTKHAGETMDQFIVRIRKEIKCNKIAYIGRLDPMARGIVPILVGKEECKTIEKHLNSNKIYQFKIIIGFKTDSDDPLGIITKQHLIYTKDDIDNIISNIKKYIEEHKKTFFQKYHYFSTKMINHRLRNNFDEMNHEVYVIDGEIISHKLKKYNKLITKIIKQIKSIDQCKDFRQEETITQWNNIIIDNIDCIKIKLHVSSGFFIRQFVNDISIYLNIPMMCYDINRLSIC